MFIYINIHQRKFYWNDTSSYISRTKITYHALSKLRLHSIFWFDKSRTSKFQFPENRSPYIGDLLLFPYATPKLLTQEEAHSLERDLLLLFFSISFTILTILIIYFLLITASSKTHDFWEICSVDTSTYRNTRTNRESYRRVENL